MKTQYLSHYSHQWGPDKERRQLKKDVEIVNQPEEPNQAADYERQYRAGTCQPKFGQFEIDSKQISLRDGEVDMDPNRRHHSLGNVKLNFEPRPGSDSTATLPPCCSTTSRTNDRPRPVDSSSLSWP